MKLYEKIINDCTLIVTLEGDLTTYVEIDQLHRVLTTRQQKNMVIDLEKVSLLSSLAIAMMIMGFRQSLARSGRFILCNPPKEVLKSLKYIGIYDVLVFAENEASALDLINEKEKE